MKHNNGRHNYKRSSIPRPSWFYNLYLQISQAAASSRLTDPGLLSQANAASSRSSPSAPSQTRALTDPRPSDASASPADDDVTWAL
ncbi:hypothetical protein FKM82_008088, partial [Ascaphus truei]